MNTQTSSQIRDFLRQCNLLEYYDRFISEGFDQLESLLDVTESDLIAMDVKRGHRRRLQREISTAKGFPQSAPLYIRHGLEDSDNQIHSTIHFQPSNNVPQQVPYFSGPQSTNSATLESRNGSSRGDDTPDQQDHPENGGSKRKYKRHPKRDKNAPIKPLSAYVMFAHKIREEYAGQNISFPDMAKIVGERWKNVSPQVKEAIENEAAKNKEEYQAAMAVYKTTESWKKYQEYLKEFKEKYESNSRDSNKRNKRQKTTSPDSDNTPPSGYSSTRSTSVGYDNSSGNVSSESSNGNGNGHGHGHNVQHLSYSNYSLNSNNCLPPYPHTNPTVSYARYTNNNRGNSSSTFLTPPSSTNNGNNSTASTILEDLYAKDDSNVGDDQSQLGNSSSSGNGNSSSGSGRSAERPNVEDSDNSITSSSNSTPPACFMEADDNQDRQSRQQSSQNQIDQIKMLDHNHTDKITRNN